MGDFVLGGILSGRDFVLEPTKISCKQVYKILIKPETKRPTAQTHLASKFNVEDGDWSKIHLLPMTTSTDTKRRMFQYKILINILYLSNLLFRMGISDSPICYSYERQNEDTDHLFAHCEISLSLWDRVRAWL